MSSCNGFGRQTNADTYMLIYVSVYICMYSGSLASASNCNLMEKVFSSNFLFPFFFALLITKQLHFIHCPLATCHMQQQVNFY